MNIRTSPKPIIYKLVFMGDSGVGKSSLANRIVSDTFLAGTEATIGASYFSKFIVKDGQQYNFNIWDTAGQEKYNCLVPLYYRNSDAAILVYDITNRKSYENAKKRIPELRDKSSVSTVMLIGNKADLGERQIETDEASEFAAEKDILHLETSAKTSLNIHGILETILDELPMPAPRSNTMPLVPCTDTYSSPCCNI